MRIFTYLIVFRGQLVETLLDDVIPVEILDKHYDMEAQSKYDGVNLSIVFEVSLPSPTRKCYNEIQLRLDLPVDEWTGNQSFFVLRAYRAY